MASESIISRLATRLTGATSNRSSPDMATRSIGGSFRNNQPYISGYFHAMFELPDTLFGSNKDVASKWFN